MNILLGCIADDFTGATDLAGILARSGVPVSLRLGVPDASVTSQSHFEIIALKCRTSPVDEAVRDTLAAADWLLANGARQLYWKYCSTFDSTPLGNIGPVSEALLQRLADQARFSQAPRQTLYCPAFPDNARSIYMSNLFVGSQPLHESPMRNHPLTPMQDSNLVRLLEPQVTEPVGALHWPLVRQGAESVRDGLQRLQSEGCTHVVVDAVESDDLAAITEGAGELPLLTGGSALALHIPERYQALGWLQLDSEHTGSPPIDTGRVVLSGSCSAMTRQQVARYSAHAPAFRLDPLALTANDQLEQARAWLIEQGPDAGALLYASADPDDVAAAQAELGRDAAGAVVEAALASLALTAFDIGVRRFVVAGGETSGAVVQALGIDQLDVGNEITPGVPWTSSDRNGQRLALALKSGNFGQEDFFRNAFDTLDAEQVCA